MIEYPKLRPVEAIAAQEDLICLRDPLGYAEHLVFLPPEAFFLVSLFDGRHSITDLQGEFARRFGAMVPGEKVRQIVEQLEDCLFLDSDRFREAERQAIEAFRSSAVRPSAHAGGAYEAEPEALRGQLAALFAEVEAAGDSAPAAPAPTAAPSGSLPDPPVGPLRGLIAPHIDVRRGGRCFARSYRELKRASRAETFVVLGISHVPTRRPFALCAKDFATPLGAVPADREFLASLQHRLHSDFYDDEFVHRGEHSVEFQAVFLRFLYGDRNPVRIVPILCGSFAGAAVSGLPEDDPEVRDFLAALGETLAQYGATACCIAAVDLSHLGRRFGQELTLDRAVLERAESDDRLMIAKILARDAEGFFRLIQEEGDRRNVCGVPAIYSLLRLLERPRAEEAGGTAAGPAPGPVAPGRLLRYEQAVEEPTQSVVTFMGAAFYG